MKSADCYEPKVPRRTVRHRIRGVDYCINEWGDENARTMFLLHGWGDTGSTFQFLVDELSSDWRLIAPDWRGFGESHYRTECYWFPDYVADLDALLRIYSPDRAVQLVGHSMGANVAGLYAGIMPERVSAFVNIEGFGLADSDPANAPAHYRRWIEAGRERRGYTRYRSWDELVPKILKRSPAMPPDRALFVAMQWATESEAGIEIKADPAHKLPNAVQYRRAEAMACRAAIRARVLVVSGEDSDFFEAGKAWLAGGNAASEYPSAQVVTIPGAGHMAHFEQPARLARVIEDFLLQDL
ncbi:MAG TPA: alpha/beta hydrolase [Woeseiaceae bacterium]|nr:alpha/beta hydrolase [Woeseiaceae bacterium]